MFKEMKKTLTLAFLKAMELDDYKLVGELFKVKRLIDHTNKKDDTASLKRAYQEALKKLEPADYLYYEKKQLAKLLKEL